MITVSKALDTLVSKGFASSWKKVKHREYGHVVCGIVVNSDKFSLSNETYGKKSFLYFRCKTSDLAYEIRSALKEIGATFEGDSWNGGMEAGNFELRVNYFHGSRWWE